MFLNLLVLFNREQTREHAAMLALTCSAPAHPHTPSASFVIELLWIFLFRFMKQATIKEEKHASAKKRTRTSSFSHTAISRKLSKSGRIWGLRKSSWLLQPADPLQVCHFRAPFYEARSRQGRPIKKIKTIWIVNLVGT